ncbi:MAG: DUF5691 domain-containing protein [Hyphomicrobium sp.]
MSCDMEDPITSEVHARIRQAMMLGLTRQPLTVPLALQPLLSGLPEERAPALALLALAGQRQRFVPPLLPALDPVSETARRMHDDTRPVMPPVARRAMLRLAASVEKEHAGSVLAIAVRRAGEAGCRLHPFDLPGLARHIKTDAANPGLAERAYLSLVDTGSEEDEASQGPIFDRITPANWTTFPRGDRRTFVAGMRRTDAAGARALVESVWKTEQAPMRVALIESLAAGLSLDDKPFLERAATDRADSVKQKASQLLSSMPATEGFEARLAEAARCFTRPHGLARVIAAIGAGTGGSLTFALPDSIKTPAEALAARDRLFSGVPLDALASAAGAAPLEILAALPADPFYAMLFLTTALDAGETECARRILGMGLLALGRAGLTSHALLQFSGTARLAMTAGHAGQFLASSAWADVVRAASEPSSPGALNDGGRLIFTAALMPREAMQSFVATLEPLGPGVTRAARDFAGFVLALPASNAPPDTTLNRSSNS